MSMSDTRVTRVFINGRFYSKKDARISVYDRGFLYGDGVFETMRAYKGGGVFLLDKHLGRLRASAEGLGIRLPWGDSFIRGKIHRLIYVNKLKEAYIRVEVTRGVAKRAGIGTGLCGRPTLVITADRPRMPAAGSYREGVAVNISDVRRNHPGCLNPGAKTVNFLNNIMSRIDVVAELARPKKKPSKLGNYAGHDTEYFESIMLNLDGYVAEGAVSNIFIVKGGVLKTPSLKCGILPGITREAVIALAKREGIRVSESALAPEQLFTADECFLTNTSIEVMPVRKIEKYAVKNCPGEVTRLLQTGYKKMVKDSTENT
jgi:branched-chain amino acid aminotransferase